MAKNITHSSATVCWQESAIGRPFILYTVEVTESGATERAKIYRINATFAVTGVPTCRAGIVVSSISCASLYCVFSYDDPFPIFLLRCLISNLELAIDFSCMYTTT